MWAFVEGMDLSMLYSEIEAVEGGAGRPATDSRILLALRLYATVEGVGSARALDRLCGEHLAYMWICGGVGVNYHTLSDFRARPGAVLDELLTKSVAVLMKEGVVELRPLAQDGMRVRANAGAASFRRRQTLRGCMKEARQQVAVLKNELEADPAAGSRREQAARERAARERTEKVARALKRVEELEKEKSTAKEKESVRASTTDPDARVMKMGDGVSVRQRPYVCPSSDSCEVEGVGRTAGAGQAAAGAPKVFAQPVGVSSSIREAGCVATRSRTSLKYRRGSTPDSLQPCVRV